MTQLVERYQRLGQAYLSLAEQFQQLDVEHMQLRSKVVPLIKALKGYKGLVEQLKQENQALQQSQAQLGQEKAELTTQNAALSTALQTLSERYIALQGLEPLLNPDVASLLADAEQQMELIEATLQERAMELDPDLDEGDRQLLADYTAVTNWGELAIAPTAYAA